MQNDQHMMNWLWEHGGAVIRWQLIARHGWPANALQRARAQAQVLASPLVKRWLDCLRFGKIHGSRDGYFENAIHKLADLGLGAGMRELDERARPWLAWLDDPRQRARRGMMAVLERSIVCGGLSHAGYGGAAAVQRAVARRLDDLDEVTRQCDYDIYEPRRVERAALPRAMRGRFPLIKERFAPQGELRLPYIHDVIALAWMKQADLTRRIRRQREQLVRYVLHPEYQKLRSGYGFLREPGEKRTRIYVAGWSVHLPSEGQSLILMAELLGRLPLVRRHPWWHRTLDTLEKLRTNQNLYRFPGSWLIDERDRYWVGGGHMRLEPGRRDQRLLTRESTFRMLRLRQLAGR